MRRTRVAISAAGVALALFTGACAQTAVAHAQPAGPSAARATARPDQAYAPAVGVNLWVTRDYSLAQTKAWGQRNIKYIAQNLGLHAIAIDWDYNVPGLHSNTVDATGPRTPSIADIKALTTIAKSYNLRVEYRVLFAINNKDTRSRSISPANLHAWIESLFAAEIPALQLAENEKVSEFVAGTEMASIDENPIWGVFFSAAGLLYHGILSYASWGGNPAQGGFFSPKRVLLPLTYYGVSAYPSINLPSTASVAQLVTAWKNILRYAPPGVLARTAIDEIGIRAVPGAFLHPWLMPNSGTPTRPSLVTEGDVAQARWFQAACIAAGAVRMRGIYFWSLQLSEDPANPSLAPTEWVGRPLSVAAIKNCASLAEGA